MGIVKLAVVFLVVGGIVVWHTGKESRADSEGSLGEFSQDESPSLGQNDLQKSSTER